MQFCSGKVVMLGTGEMTDAEIMEEFSRTERMDLWSEIYRRHYDRAVKYVSGQIRARFRYLIEEVCQEFFLRLYSVKHKYNPANPFLPWFYVVLRNTMINTMRRERKFVDRRFSVETMDTVSTQGDPLPSINEDAIFELIDPELRPVVRAIYFDGKSIREAANQFGIGKDACFYRLEKAIGQVRARMVSA
jgi:RNA polymerase sigma-70 factor (ECF subfamily)